MSVKPSKTSSCNIQKASADDDEVVKVIVKTSHSHDEKTDDINVTQETGKNYTKIVIKPDRNSNFIRNRSSTLRNEISKILARIPIDVSDRQTGLELRKSLLALDGVCEYCRKNRACTVDHFNPLVKDGIPTKYCSDLWNSVPSCSTCNSSKGNRSAVDWLSSQSKHNPCLNMDDSKSRTVIKQWNKYQIECDKHCILKTLDDEWFKAIDLIVKQILEILQTHINSFCGRCTVETSGPNDRTTISYGFPDIDKFTSQIYETKSYLDKIINQHHDCQNKSDDGRLSLDSKNTESSAKATTHSITNTNQIPRAGSLSMKLGEKAIETYEDSSDKSIPSLLQFSLLSDHSSRSFSNSDLLNSNQACSETIDDGCQKAKDHFHSLSLHAGPQCSKNATIQTT